MHDDDDESNLNYAINLIFHELLLVSRIVHSLLNRGNHVKVEALIMPPPPPPPPPSHHSQFPHTQFEIIKNM
jgi:hypothetical protein